MRCVVLRTDTCGEVSTQCRRQGRAISAMIWSYSPMHCVVLCTCDEVANLCRGQATLSDRIIRNYSPNRRALIWRHSPMHCVVLCTCDEIANLCREQATSSDFIIRSYSSNRRALALCIVLCWVRVMRWATCVEGSAKRAKEANVFSTLH